MYEIFKQLCEVRNVTSYKVAKDTGISSTTLSAWKKGLYTPKQKTLLIISNYFNVSLNYLMTGTDKDTEEQFGKETSALIAKIKNDTALTQALQIYFELPPNKKQHVIDIIHMLGDKD